MATTTPPDVLEIITVDGISYKVPTNVLMQKSGYFRALLDTDCMELSEGKVTILQESSDYSLIHKLMVYPDDFVSDVLQGSSDMQNSILMYNMKYFQLPKSLIENVVDRIGLPCHTCSARTMKGSFMKCSRGCLKTLCAKCSFRCRNCNVDLCLVCSPKCLRCGEDCCTFCVPRGLIAMSLKGRDLLDICPGCQNR